MAFTNYHGHCHYCDGKESPEQYVQAALAQQMPAYGFSSHAPLPFDIAWPMQEEASRKYVAEINELKVKYAGQIEIYVGMEVDFIPGVAGPGHQRIRSAGLDYTVGSVHFVDFFPDGHPWEIDGAHQVFLDGLQQIFHGNPEQAVRRYYALIRQMLQEDPPDILGHLDKIKIQSEEGCLFDEQDSWYQEEIAHTLDVIAATDVIVEVNTRGLYKKKSLEPYPGYRILERMKKMNIPVMLNADAHHPREITAHFTEVASCLQQMGYDHMRILLNKKWQHVPFTTEGLQYTQE